MTVKYVEFEEGAACPENLADRVMAGEIFVARRCLQTLGIFDEITATSLDAIRSAAGADAAENIEREGFDAIHHRIDIHCWKTLVGERRSVDAFRRAEQIDPAFAPAPRSK